MDTSKEIEKTVKEISKTREVFRKRVSEAIAEVKAKKQSQTEQSTPIP